MDTHADCQCINEGQQRQQHLMAQRHGQSLQELQDWMQLCQRPLMVRLLHGLAVTPTDAYSRFDLRSGVEQFVHERCAATSCHTDGCQ